LLKLKYSYSQVVQAVVAAVLGTMAVVEGQREIHVRPRTRAAEHRPTQCRRPLIRP